MRDLVRARRCRGGGRAGEVPIEGVSPAARAPISRACGVDASVPPLVNGPQFSDGPQHITLQEYRDTIDETERRVARLTEHLRQLAPTWRWAPLVAALQALRGVSVITAVELVAELGDLTRFGHPRELMAYLGLVPSEYSSGPSVRRGGITKAGTPHVRRLLAEAAWAYQGIPRVGRQHAYRQEALPKVMCDIAWKAQLRLTTVPSPRRARQGQTESRHRDRTRAHGLRVGDRAGGLAGIAVTAPRAQDVVVHRSFRRYGDQVENPRGR
jgi:transposase